MTSTQYPPSSISAYTSLRLVDPIRIGSEEEFAVPWQSALRALDGSWCAASASKLVVPGGYSWIELKAGISFETNAEGMRQIYSRRNGSNERPQGYRAGYMSHTHPGRGDGPVLFTAHSAIMPVEPGDYFELMVFQNAGVSLRLGGHGGGAARQLASNADGDVFLEARFW